MEHNKWSKSLKEFILTYKKHTHLWDVSDKDYMNRKKRLAALQDLRPLLGENTSIEMVRKKIDMLRTTYFREWRKVQASKSTALSPKDIYTPTLWYYNLLSFLAMEDESKSNSYDNVESERNSYLYALLNESDNKDLNPIIKKEKRQSTEDLDEFAHSIKNDNIPIMKKEKRQTKEELASKKKILEKSIDTARRNNSFGLYLSQQLQNVPNDQRTFAEKLMSDILFMARTNQLNGISQIITPLESNYLSDYSECD